MSPIKFFRRYSRILVLVLMSLLLVVFLVGDVVGRQISSPIDTGRVIGEAFGEKLRLGEYFRSNAELEVLGMFRPLQIDLVSLFRGEDEQGAVMTYLLLTKEAQRLGVRVSEEEVKEALAQGGVQGSYIDEIRRRSGMSLANVYGAIGKALSVIRAAELQFAAAMETTPRLRAAYRNRMQKLDLRVSIITAAALRSQIPEPGDEALREFFEQAKNRDTAHTDTELVFGYRIPDRVRIEYLTVDPNALVDDPDLRVSEREMRRFYEDNVTRYNLPPSTNPASQPALKTFDELTDEVRAKVRADCRADKASREAQRWVNRLYEEARRPWIAPAGEDGFRPAPAQDLSFESLRQRFASEVPIILKRTELVTTAELSRDLGIGQARYREGDIDLKVPELAMRVKGLYTPQPNERAPVLNVNEPAPIVALMRPYPANPARFVPVQLYLVRVIEVAPAGPPESLDAVREKVREDYITLKAFELAGEYARQLAEQARQTGLVSAVEQAAELRRILAEADEAAAAETEPAATQPVKPPTAYIENLGPFIPQASLTRQSRFLPKVGAVPATLRDELFKLVSEPEATTQTAHRVAVAASTSNQHWIVAQVEQVQPLYEGDFAKQRDLFAQMSEQGQIRAIWGGWFDPANVRRRAKFEPVTNQ